ncbi:DUF418 domain-containing protein [Phycisphaeraceae bacterium D3-23]
MSQATPAVPAPQNPLTPAAPLVPTSGGERIVSIDVLRGVVLLGILVMNIPFMGWPEAWAMDGPRFADDTPLALGLWFVADVFTNMKMMSIFSLLFGAGVVMVADRAIAAGRPPAKLHYKRMGWLLAIGLVHAFLMWYGDILVGYALIGSIVYLLRRLPIRWLVAAGSASLMVSLLATLAFAGLFALWKQGDPSGYAEFDFYETALIPGEIEAYRGGPGAQFQVRWPSALAFILFIGPMMFYWWSGGMMLLGMAAMKARVITGARSSGFYAAMLGVGFGIGLPLASGLAWLKIQPSSGDGVHAMLMFAAHYVPTVFMVCGWVGLVLLLCKQPWFAKLTYPLSCVGRMALTNYLAQTLLVTLIFYGHGLGYFAKLERPAMYAIVLGVWTLQLIWSPLWLACFRFGPMEWVWRSLTYLRLEPMRKRAASGGGA